MRFKDSGEIRPRAALVGDIGPAGETIEGVYGPARLDYLRRATCLYPHIVTSRSIESCLDDLREVEVLFATWGLIPLTAAQLDHLPCLKAVFYAAGSVRHFARPMLERGITVVSAWAANAVPVAELTLGQILLANKGWFRNTREYHGGTTSYASAFRGRGNFGATVAILGAGKIGRRVIELLRLFPLPVVVFDPFLSHKGADLLGVEKVPLEEAFARGQVVSNHLADVPETRGLLNASLFERLPPDATFINTGRGETVAQDDLITVLRARSDLTALLDVTDPEPLPACSPLWTLPNAHISSHIAGAIHDEIGRLPDTILEEFEAWRDGRSLRYAVTLPMLETMA